MSQSMMVLVSSAFLQLSCNERYASFGFAGFWPEYFVVLVYGDIVCCHLL